MTERAMDLAPADGAEHADLAGPTDLASLLAQLGVREAERVAHGPWLVVAAHPDDECVGATFILSRAARLTIAYVTDGAPHDRALWSPAAPAEREQYAALRLREALAALAFVGVSERQVRRLGFADQCTVDALVPLVRALCALCDELRPAVMVTHPYEGGHPDHDASAFATHAACALLCARGDDAPVLLEMSSYHRAHGALCTGRFLAAKGRVVTRVLTPEERERKRAMLRAHASQAAVLAPFGVDEEPHRLAPTYAFDEPPHAGLLHYETLGWSMTGHELCARALAARTALGLTTEREV